MAHNFQLLFMDKYGIPRRLLLHIFNQWLSKLRKILWWIWKENKKQSFIDRKKLFFLLRSAVIRVKAWRQKPEYCWTQQLSRNSCLIMFLLRTWISKGLFYTSLAFFTGYSFWDWLRNFLHKFPWIVLSVHKLNKIWKFW